MSDGNTENPAYCGVCGQWIDKRQRACRAHVECVDPGPVSPERVRERAALALALVQEVSRSVTTAYGLATLAEVDARLLTVAGGLGEAAEHLRQLACLGLPPDPSQLQ